MSTEGEKPFLLILAAIAISCAVGTSAALLVGSKPFVNLDWRIYDRYLGFIPSPPAPRAFLVLQPDGRDGIKGLSASGALSIFRLLDEFEVDRLSLAGAAFDGGQESEALTALRSELPVLIDREDANIEENVRALFGAIRSGSVSPKESSRYIESLAEIIKRGGERIKEAASQSLSPTLRALEAEAERFRPPAPSFFETREDQDGRTRKILLIRSEGGRILPRAELAAMMAWLGDPALKVESGRLTLVGARFAEGGKRDLVIPVDGEGRALIGWPRPGSANAPRTLALSELLSVIRDEDSLVAKLEAMGTGGLLTGEGAALLSRYREAERLREERAVGDASASVDWREARRGFFAAARAYLEGGREAEMISALAAGKAKPISSIEELSSIDDRIASIKAAFKDGRACIERLSAGRVSLSKSLRGSFAFLSLSEGKAPIMTSYGAAASAAYEGAVFASAALSGTTPRRLPARELPLALALGLSSVAAAAFLIAAPSIALCIGLGLAVLGLAISIASFAVQAVYLPPLPLFLGPATAALAAFALSRGRLLRGGQATRKAVAVAAFKSPGLLRAIEGQSPRAALRTAVEFRSLVEAAIKRQGGILAASDGSTLLAYFEEREGAEAPVLRALEAAIAATKADLAQDIEPRAGIDLGECLISDAGILGLAADLALRLADLNAHYGTRILASGAALGMAGKAFSARLLGEIEVEATGRKATLYSIREERDP